MCDSDCTDHGQTIYVPAHHRFITWPDTDDQLTEAIEALTIERGRD